MGLINFFKKLVRKFKKEKGNKIRYVTNYYGANGEIYGKINIK